VDNHIRVGITTVSLNSEKTIGRTIESVLTQTYPVCSYVVKDGGSEDRTVEIAKSYCESFQKKGISYTVVSLKDNGMYDAINQAIALTDGELLGNINSDDYYEPDAVKIMVSLFTREHYDAAWGDLRMIKETGSKIKRAHMGKRLWTTGGWNHPCMFIRRSLWEEHHYACENMYDDFEFITYAHTRGKKIVLTNEIISNFTTGGMSTRKSLKDAFYRVNIVCDIYHKYGMSGLYRLQRLGYELAKWAWNNR